MPRQYKSLPKVCSVVWFNLGMHHMPHTGDLPNTVFSTAHSAITIEPFNYLAGDPSRATTQQVRINSIAGGGNGSVTGFGAKPVTCSVDPVCSFHLSRDLDGVFLC